MKKAFISTVYNEEDNARSFIESLLMQSVMPNEIVIVDAGSQDNTVEVIKDLLKKIPKNKYKVLVKRGNRSVGRNFAIKNTKCEIIAASDFGCILDKNWFDRITKPLQKTQNDVVAGFYRPKTNSVFEECLATYTCVPEDKITNDFLPSSRSIAFTKESWRKVGGYPEELNTCEDLVFARNLKRLKLKFSVVKNALVYWPQRKNIVEAAKQFYSYSFGDGRAGYYRSQTPMLFLRYFVGLSLLVAAITYNDLTVLLFLVFLLFLYTAWAINKNYRLVRQPGAYVYLPLLQVVSDVAVIVGMITGYFSRISGTK